MNDRFETESGARALDFGSPPTVFIHFMSESPLKSEKT